ncbi:MAG TPA: hypothetical protein PLO41_02250 [Rubrivivax sp.]|nr:hypothetical protein [Rubrivivax sp.]
MRVLAIRAVMHLQRLAADVLDRCGPIEIDPVYPDRATVGGQLRQPGSAERAVHPWHVVLHDRLTDLLLQLRTQEAAEDV